MNKKTALIVALGLFLVLGATGLTASDWVGTFSGDAEGAWKGTLNPNQDPCFTGIWEEISTYPPHTGYLRGTHIERMDNYYYVKGDVLNEENQDIGDWSGNFPIPDGQASGTWVLDNGDTGTFIGYQP